MFSLTSTDLGGFLKKEKKKKAVSFFYSFSPNLLKTISIISYLGTHLASVPLGIRYLRVRHLNSLTNCLLTKRLHGISHSAHTIVFLTFRECYYSCQRAPRLGRS